MNTYTTAEPVTVPGRWLYPFNAPTRVRAAHLVVTARTRAEAAAVLTRAGMKPADASATQRHLRLRVTEHVQQMLDRQVIDPDRPAVYLWLRTADDSPIRRVRADTSETVAHFVPTVTRVSTLDDYLTVMPAGW